MSVALRTSMYYGLPCNARAAAIAADSPLCGSDDCFAGRSAARFGTLDGAGVAGHPWPGVVILSFAAPEHRKALAGRPEGRVKETCVVRRHREVPSYDRRAKVAARRISAAFGCPSLWFLSLGHARERSPHPSGCGIITIGVANGRTCK